MGEAIDTLSNTIEVTFSTRCLIRRAALTVRHQPLARQGIQHISYVLDRSLAYHASRETRAMLHELVERIFPQQEDLLKSTVSYGATQLTGAIGIQCLEQKLKSTALTDLQRFTYVDPTKPLTAMISGKQKHQKLVLRLILVLKAQMAGISLGVLQNVLIKIQSKNCSTVQPIS